MSYKEYLNFDDVRIVPNTPTDLVSRKHANVEQWINNIELKMPVIVPSMRSLVSTPLIYNVEQSGGMVIQPRSEYRLSGIPCYNSSLDTALEVAEKLYEKVNSILSIEIANGHMKRMGEVISKVKKNFPFLPVWAGTVATSEGVNFLADSGADAAIIGIGVGSACITTDKTGVGLPMFGTILECSENSKIPIISAGGLRNPGDFVKAIAAGADAAMIGALLRGCSDLKEPDIYYGMASVTEKKNRAYIEGREFNTKVRNETSIDVIIRLREALQSAMSYVGARNLTEFRNKVKFAKVK